MSNAGLWFERRCRVQLGLFIDKAASLREIEAAMFLEDQIAATQHLLSMIRRHELTIDWPPHASEPTFRQYDEQKFGRPVEETPVVKVNLPAD